MRAAPALVPELLVTDLPASLRFWCGLCGFAVRYERPEEGFAYLARDGAEVMLEALHAPGWHWVSGPMERPFGRGLNFQIEVPAVEPIVAALAAAGWPLHLAAEERWYRVADAEHGQRQFLVQDPDGYLLRFCSPIGRRPA